MSIRIAALLGGSSLGVIPLFFLAPVSAEAQGLSGTWSGNYRITEPPPSCPTMPPYWGGMTMNFSANGSGFSGSASLTEVPQSAGGNCTITSYNTDSASISGSISGSQVTGEFSGGPLDSLTFSATISGTQMSGTFTDINGAFTLTGSSCSTLAIGGPTDLGNIDPTNPNQKTLQLQYQAQCGTPPYTWTLPSPFFGLSFSNCSGSTCTLSGSPVGPTQPSGNLFFQPLIVTDAAGNKAKIVIDGLIQVKQPPPVLQSRTVSDSTWTGHHYVFNFEDVITGGIGIFSCTPLSAPPANSGLSLGTGNSSCLLGGTAGSPGVYTFSVKVTDGSTPSQTATYTLNVTIKSPNSASPSATPQIYQGGVVDVSAGQQMMTPGSVMVLYGNNLSDSTYYPSSGLPTSLGNVQVSVNGQNAPLFYVGKGQINFQAPSDPSVYYPAGTSCLQINTTTYYPSGCPAAPAAQVTVYRNGVASGTATVPLQLSAPTISQYQTSGGVTAPIILSDATNQLIGPSNGVQGNDIVSLYGTGLGVPTCQVQSGAPNGSGCLANAIPQITFPEYPALNTQTNVQYAGLTPGGVGLAQFNVQMPPQLPPSSSGSIRMRVGDPSTGQTFPLFLKPGTGGPIVNTAMMSASDGTSSGSCVLPKAVTGFSTGFPLAWLYFDVLAKVGDKVTVNFVRPDGVVYQSSNGTSGYTNECFSYSLTMAGTAAANYPGTWKAQVYWNGAAAPLISLPFYVSPITFTKQSVTAQAPAASGCVVPPSATGFTTASGTAYLYFSATVTPSDNLTAAWLAPDASVPSTENWSSNPGTFCFTGASLGLSGLPNSKLGTWVVQVFDNGSLLFSIPFVVTR